MREFIRKNSLSITFLALFVCSMAGQFFTGYSHYNEQRAEDGQQAVGYTTYFQSGHFIQATFENWESEFLQMALFVLLTIWLRQKGSSESKKCDGPEEVDREPDPNRPGAPWPVRKGGLVLRIYKHSLTIALLTLFVASMIAHFYGSLKDTNEERVRKGMTPVSSKQYVGESRFWFESFQNWQSEFLSVFAIIALSIFLRQQGSPQSKPVDAPDDETGE
jgi:flagellar basal body-associated protein FliL